MPISKPNLVLLSGLLCDDTLWTGITGALGDLVSATRFSFADFSAIAAMADAVLAAAPAQFILVGHSMGGRVALEVFRKAPERVQAIGLFNTGVHPMAAHEPESRGRLVALAKQSGMAALAQEWLPPMMDGERRPNEALMAELTAMVQRATPESFERQITALLNRPNAQSVLPQIKVPTLLLSATGDRWSPVAQHDAMRRWVPHADLVVIENAGHMAPAEQPAAVAKALGTWIRTLGVDDKGAPENA